MRPRYILEYAALRAVCGLLTLLPYRLALGLAWGLAWLAHWAARYRVATARSRLRAVLGPGLSEADARRMAWRAWRDFVFSLVDLIRVAATPVETLRGRVREPPAIAFLEERARTGQGGIIVSIHMGSWEMVPKLSATHGMRLFTIGGAQKNPLVSAYLARLREGTGFDTLLRGSSAVKGILARIKKGEFLAMLVDLRQKQPDLEVDFLGGRANVTSSAATFARHCGVPIVPFVMTRVGWTRHEYRLFDPIWPDMALDKEADIQRMTQAVFTLFDRCIRERPDQYFWFNKRWILDPLPKPAPESAAPPGPAGT